MLSMRDWKDFDMLRIDARLAVIEEQLKQINKKLD